MSSAAKRPLSIEHGKLAVIGHCDAEKLGRMLTRADAMASGRAQEASDVTDAVWAEDGRLIEAIHGTT